MILLWVEKTWVGKSNDDSDVTRQVKELKSFANIETPNTMSESLRRQSKISKNVFFSRVSKMTFLGGNLLAHIFDAHPELPKLENMHNWF